MTRIILCGCGRDLQQMVKINCEGAAKVILGMAPAWKWVMRTTQHVFNEVCGRPTVFAIKVEAKSPALRLLEYVVPLA